MRRDFRWPQVRAAPSVTTILDTLKQTDKVCRLPTKESAKTLVVKAFKECFEHGHDPRSTPILIDIDASPRFASYGIDEAKTLTRTRGGDGGPWISTRSRRVSLEEMAKLQGFQKGDIQWDILKITPRQTGQLLGNAVSVNTIGCILEEALWSAGLTKEKVPFPRER